MHKPISYPKKSEALKARHAAMTEQQKATLNERRLAGVEKWRKKVKAALEAVNGTIQ